MTVNIAGSLGQADKLEFDASGNLKVTSSGGGGGVAQLQVRDVANTWTDIGYFAGNLAVPVEQSGAWSVSINNTPIVNQGTAGATAWKVDGSGVTQPISVVSLPLPSGASTSALQTTGNTSLSSIDGKLTTTANGVKVDGSAATQPVSGTFWQAVQPVSGTFWQATQPVSGTITATQSGVWSTGRTWSLVNTTDSVNVGNFPATQPVSVASLPLPSGASTEATLALIKAKTDNIDVLLSTRTKPADVQSISGTVATKTDLTPSAPAAAAVGVTSAQVLAANANRKGLVVVNTSSNVISIGLGSAAVLNSGITLTPYGTFEMDEYCFDVGAVNAIASAAASNLAIQEFAV